MPVMADSLGPDGSPVAIPTSADTSVDTWAEQPGSAAAQMVPWVVVVVRAWAHEDRVIVRMTMSRAGHPPVVHYEPSGPGAGRQLAHWLGQSAPLGVHPPADPAGDGAETTR
jgi:hypothetical protein